MAGADHCPIHAIVSGRLVRCCCRDKHQQADGCAHEYVAPAHVTKQGVRP